MPLIDFNTLSPANPATPPTGWFKPAAAGNAQIVLVSGVNLFARSAGTAIWLNSTQYTGNTLVSKGIHPANLSAAGTVSIRCLLNTSFNGYCLYFTGDASTAEIRTVANCVVGGTALATFSSLGAGYNKNYEIRCVDKTTGTFQFWLDNVKIGSDFVDTTYSSLVYYGVGAIGGRARTIDGGELFDVLTLTDPIVAGQPFSGTCVGSTDGAGTLTAGGLAVPMTVAGGGTTFSGTWPLPADDTLYPVMNSASINFTWAKDGNSEVLARAFNAPSGTAVTQFGIVIDTDPLYLGYPFDQAGNPLLTGEYVYAELPSPAVIDPDSRVRDFDSGDLPYETTLVIHRTNGKTYLHDMTFTASGVGPTPTPSENGLTSVGATSIGLTSTGLTSVGL
jgi:hypothetical protein